ncbi:MAG: type II toxin-antitoxin system HicA family toxin [bacterium]
MSKLYSSREISLVLNILGYNFISQNGSHGKFKNTEGIITILPMNKKEIPEGTLSGILRQVKITKKEFVEILKMK